jgi:hypothetical protein
MVMHAQYRLKHAVQWKYLIMNKEMLNKSSQWKHDSIKETYHNAKSSDGTNPF